MAQEGWQLFSDRSMVQLPAMAMFNKCQPQVVVQGFTGVDFSVLFVLAMINLKLDPWFLTCNWI